MRTLALLVVMVPIAAVAQPKPARGVPTKSVPCAMDDLTLHASGTDPVVCWPGGCMKLDPNAHTATTIAKPPAAKSWLAPVAEVKPDTVCLGTTCKKLGKKLVAAIAEARKEATPDYTPQIAATTDLKTVVVREGAWSVAADKPLKFKNASRGPDKPNVVGIEVAGDLLVVDWSACAGPCTTMHITDSSGRNIGAETTGGGALLQLDAKRFVVIAEYASVQIFDLKTGKPRGGVDLGGQPTDARGVRIDDETLGLLYEEASSSGNGLRFVKVVAFDDKDSKPHVSETMYLPSCKN